MSNIECIVLGIIHAGYCYGHDLDRAFKTQHMELWTKTTRVSIYQALTRIEKKRLGHCYCRKKWKFPGAQGICAYSAGSGSLAGDD